MIALDNFSLGNSLIAVVCTERKRDRERERDIERERGLPDRPLIFGEFILVVQ